MVGDQCVYMGMVVGGVIGDCGQFVGYFGQC